jgi:HSP20 family protein
MPFFHPQAFPSSEAAFIQLLSELDRPQQKSACIPRRQAAFTPRFDVTEVADAYELFGELPGLQQKEISIEFSDAQTLVIKGKTRRHAIKEPIAAQDPALEISSDAESEKSSHTATVEDDYDEADTPLTTPATAAAAPAEIENPAEAETPKQKVKLWIAERKTGQFERSFAFEQRLEHDGVKASLNNGVLHVVVPKSRKPKTVAVSIN